ncbi:MAG: DUF559 domain-containing protein [Candidatus Aenigmarchaeota archaeon]|nr:DUF559 domain-containing protein [Candidatus Aenigmarchaeota archaeon]
MRGKLKLTSLELKVKEILDSLGVRYIAQYPTRTGFIIDFAIITGDNKIAIEVDGEKWHSTKRQKKRDRFKDYQLKREGWKIIRIKEKDISSEYIKEKLENMSIVKLE